VRRRTALLAGLATAVAGPFLSPVPAARAQDGQGNANRLWFDPTQLPSFTGVVDRYLINPEGKTDRLLFREGPQVIFPEHVGGDIAAAIPPGRSIIVYGIRSRRVPAITLLAWTRDSDTPVRFVDRPTWTFPEFRAADEHLEVAGTVRTPLYTPQGDVIGAVLDDGTVIRVPAGIAQALGDRLSPGRSVAASGRGATAGERGRALDADRLGESLDKLEPLPASAGRAQ